MCSRGTPMFLAGDEFGNTRNGNNNPYCQDNEISWLNWKLLKENQKLFEFFKFMIHFRQKHPVIRKALPKLHNSCFWYLSVNTYGDEQNRCYPEGTEVRIDNNFIMRPRSVAIFTKRTF